LKNLIIQDTLMDFAACWIICYGEADTNPQFCFSQGSLHMLVSPVSIC
jgi:hypothetical protein